MTSVPVGRRLLFVERRRAALTVLGVAAALLLVLVLDGIFAGAIDRVTSYIRSSSATVFVSQAGVRTMHMSASALPADTPAAIAAVPGVDWAAPIGFATVSAAGPGSRQLSYLIGYDTATGRGGPAELVAGRSPRTSEAVVDEQGAAAMGVGLGDTVTILGTPLSVAGLSTGGTSITNTTIFVSAEQFGSLRGHAGHAGADAGPGAISYVLVATRDEASARAVADRIEATVPGVTAQTRAEFASSEAGVVEDMSADLLRLMSLIGLLIAMAVIALGLMTATLSRIRDFAVLKALGAPVRRLAGAVAVQVVWTVVLATATAAVLALLLGQLVPAVAPSVQISITPAALARTTVEALVIGLAAALWPLRRIAAVDPATAFRENR